MSDLMRRLEAKRALTPPPGQGYNVVGVDPFEDDPGQNLHLIDHFATRAEAEAFIAKSKRRYIINLEIYGSEE